MKVPDFSDVQRAAERIKGVAHVTPVLTSRHANALTGAELFFKCENLQRMGAFKFRGAYNAMSALDDARKQRGVVAFSSGNHAQAIALAGQLLGVKTAIVMPADAPALKIAATRGYQAASREGGEVILYDRYKDDREVIGHKLADERGYTMIPPYDHADVIAGAGTSALELCEWIMAQSSAHSPEDPRPLDFLLVCLGGGGLTAGCALATKALFPNCQVIGVEPEAGNDVQQSLRSGKVVKLDHVPQTLADGAQTQAVGTRNFAVLQQLVSDVVTVSDAQLVSAMRFFAERMKMIVEPTGCLAAAAALEGIVPVRGKRVGVLISGGNIDLARFTALVSA